MNWIKFAIWVPWLSVIGFMIFLAGGLDVVNMYYQTDHGISVSKLEDYIIYYFFLVLIVGLAFTAGKRSFCHYICWMAPFMMIGTKLSQWICLPRLHIRAESDKCTECQTCSRNCPMSLEVTEMVQKGSLENSECIYAVPVWMYVRYMPFNGFTVRTEKRIDALQPGCNPVKSKIYPRKGKA